MTHPFIISARHTIDIEAQALLRLKDSIDESFVDVVQTICATKGRIIVMGIGKSGHIARKIAATLASTGTPAFFVHPAEASHGDLGMITNQDVILAISNSGEANEINELLPYFRRMSIPLIALTRSASSTLGKYSNYFISTKVEQEACPHNLAPTASTTAQLAIGDALAIACMQAKGFQSSDFAATHPGGSLGRKHLMRVADVMRSGANLPIVDSTHTISQMIEVMNQSGLGLAIQLDKSNQPIGIFTDGDLRRALLDGVSFINLPITVLMKTNPKSIHQETLAVEAAAIMEHQKITSILAVNDLKALTGIVNTNDLLRAKII